MSETTANPLQELAELFRERLRVIEDKAMRESDPALQLRKLQEVSEKITALEKELPSDTDPQFRHFMQGCSYSKALAWIEANHPSGIAS